jgi:cystathionine beta-lyase
VQHSFGAILGPQDSWLLLRGMKTLAVRMEAQQRTAAALAPQIAALPGVRRVHFPGLATHAGHAVHARQARGPGAVLSLELESEALAKAFLRALRLPVLAVSLGGVETIASYPATMSHAAMPLEERERRGISGALVRLSIGLEGEGDLLADIQRALVEAAASATRPADLAHALPRPC